MVIGFKKKYFTCIRTCAEFYCNNFRNFSKYVHKTYSAFALVLNMQFKRWVFDLKACDSVENMR